MIDPSAPHVLVVCTANVCRSPVAQHVLRRRWSGLPVDVSVGSAGTRGGRLGVHPDTVAAAAELGVDLSDHRSRRLTHRLLEREGTGLVIAMARGHLYHVIATDESAWPRTFTLVELVGRSEALAASGFVADGFAGWVAALGEGRRSGDLMPGRRSDDVADPYGRSPRHHRRMVREVDALCARLCAAAGVVLASSPDAPPG